MTDTTDDKVTADQMLRMVKAMIAEPGSDARAGLGAIVREIETAHPGFIAKLNAVNDGQRLGLKIDVAPVH